jgi:hypothetical protein
VTPVPTLELHPETPTPASRATLSPAATPATGDRRPPLFVPRDELIFWTREWRAGEAESAAEREAGNLRTFRSGEDMLAWLRSDDD